MIEDSYFAKDRVKNLKGKTYEQIYGKKKGNKRRKTQMINTKIQMKDSKQIQNIKFLKSNHLLRNHSSLTISVSSIYFVK